MPENEAQTTAQDTGSTPVTAPASAEIPAIDLSPLGDTFKDVKVQKDLFEKFVPLFKDKPDDFKDYDPADHRLYRMEKTQWVKRENERNTELGRKSKAYDEKMREIEDMRGQVDRDKETFYSMMGDSLYYTDQRVQDAMKKAREIGLEENDVRKYAQPFVDLAKSEHQNRMESDKKQLEQISREIGDVSDKMFPDIPKEISDSVIAGIVRATGQKPDIAANEFKKWLDEYVSIAAERKFVESVKLANTQPESPAAGKTEKPMPGADAGDDKQKNSMASLYHAFFPSSRK
jgi:hypothetical protein